MRKISIILILLLLLSGCEKKKEEPKDERILSIETTQTEDKGTVSSFILDDHEIYVYCSEDLMHGDVINYGYSAPLLIVFGDKKMSVDEAVSLICEKRIDIIAQKNGGFVVFVNPCKDWKSEEEGIYEKILAKTMVGQSGFSNGLLYDEKSDEYFIFASPARTVLYGYGKGADYIAKHYLKKLTGTSSMSSLGSDDITITAAVLESFDQKPQIESDDIIVICRDGPAGIEESGHLTISDDSFDIVYDEYIAAYQRWNGKLSETFNMEKEGMAMEPLLFEIKTSSDNHVVKEPSYELGAVVFRKKDSEKKKKPLLLCFHGGGDTAIATASIAGWPEIAAEEDFILCAIEMHTRTTASETMQVIEKLKEIYDIDETKIYATGFSMGGIKTWDLYQEYPESFAALAPMGATVDVGKNTQFSDAPYVNEEVMVPLFYSGGENSSLGELPFQNYICVNRIEYLFKVNRVEMPFDAAYGYREEWDDPVYIYAGDQVEELCDEDYPESKTTIRYYRSEDGNIYTALCSISRHQHEVRPFTCRQAWDFMKRFSRVDGKIVINKE